METTPEPTPEPTPERSSEVLLKPWTDMLSGPESLSLVFNFVNARLRGGPHADTQPVFESFVIDLFTLVGRADPGGYITSGDYHKKAKEAAIESGSCCIKDIKSRRLDVALVGVCEYRSHEHCWSYVLRSHSTELTARILSVLGLRARPSISVEIIRRHLEIMQKRWYSIAKQPRIKVGQSILRWSAGDMVKFMHGRTIRGVMVKVAEDAVKVSEWREGTQTFDKACWIRRSAVRQVFKTTDGEKDTLATDIGYTCIRCGKSGFREHLRHCARCAGARYCSRHCQQEDWPRHKRQCQGRSSFGRRDDDLKPNGQPHQHWWPERSGA